MPTILAERDGSLGWLTLNRPEVLNAIDFELIDAFIAELGRLTADPDIRAISITGAGRAFSAGADIRLLSTGSLEDRRQMMVRGHAMMAAVEAAPKPVIAAVNGIAAGGGFELSLACDFVVAERRAQFGMTEIRYGFLPGGGGTQRLPRRVSAADAKYLLWSGEMISAGRAAELRLVARIVEDGALRQGVREFAAPFLARSPAAIAEAKALARVARDRALSEGLIAETEANMRLLQTGEALQAMTRFLDRRGTKAAINTGGKS